MFSLLHQYLISHSSLPLPGIGTLQFVYTSAQPLNGGQIIPPNQEIKLLNNEVDETNPQLIGFLSGQLDMPENQAQTLFQHFLQSIITMLGEKKTIEWENLGELKSNDNGNITFEQTEALNIYRQPIDAKRINLPNTGNYNVLVKDDETNDLAMQEKLNASPNHWWWIWAIIIAVIALVVIAVKYTRY